MQATAEITKEIFSSPEKIKHFYDIWQIASVDFDEAAFDGLLAKTFMFVDPKGSPWKWPELKETIKESKPDLKVSIRRDFEILSYADHTVLKRCIATIKGSFLGQHLDGAYRWSNIFIREDGEWKLCYYQLTRIPN